MELVSAKCPSCGANIEVDKNSDKTKCDYCGTKIIVKDAIRKFKIEISGNVEVKNAPTLENLIKIGDRHYDNGEWKEAYNEYEKALELEPDNGKLIVRCGICKSLKSNFGSFDTMPIINGLVDSINKFESVEEKDKYILESIEALLKLKQFNLSTYESYSIKTKNNIDTYMFNLYQVMQAFDMMLDLTDNNKTRTIILENGIDCVGNIIFRHIKYDTFKTNKKGKKIYNTYVLNPKISTDATEKQKKFLTELKRINPEKGQEQENKLKEMRRDASLGNIVILQAILIFLIIYGFVACDIKLFPLILIASFILLIPKYFDEVFKEKDQLGINILYIIITIGAIGTFLF